MWNNWLRIIQLIIYELGKERQTMGMISSWLCKQQFFMNHCTVCFEIRKIKEQPKSNQILQSQVMPFWQSYSNCREEHVSSFNILESERYRVLRFLRTLGVWIWLTLKLRTFRIRETLTKKPIKPQEQKTPKLTNQPSEVKE